MGIVSLLQRGAHRTADQPVDDPFGSCELRRAVMTEQQRLPHQRKIAVDDRYAQDALLGPAVVCQFSKEMLIRRGWNDAFRRAGRSLARRWTIVLARAADA